MLLCKQIILTSFFLKKNLELNIWLVLLIKIYSQFPNLENRNDKQFITV